MLPGWSHRQRENTGGGQLPPPPTASLSALPYTPNGALRAANRNGRNLLLHLHPTSRATGWQGTLSGGPVKTGTAVPAILPIQP